MAFDVSITAEEAGSRIIGRVRRIFNVVSEFKTASEDGPVPGNDLLRVMEEIFHANAEILSLQDTVGLDAYLKNITGNPTYDSLIELEAQRVAMTQIGIMVRSSFPVDAGGYLLQFKFANVIERTDRLFTTTALATLRLVITDFQATVEF